MLNSEVRELSEIVLSSTRHVLPGCGLDVGEPLEQAQEPSDPRQIVAFMGFTGDAIRGTMAIVAPLELMRQAYPLPLQEATRPDFEVFDWSGEVANRLLGRIKLELTRRGVHIEASTPRVMQGEQLHVSRSTRGTVCSACFPVRESWLRVWFDASVAEDRPLFSESTASTDGIPPEGDVLLF